MTMNGVIEYVDGVKPNVFTDDDKYRWINTLEGLISVEVLDMEEPMVYTIPDDADKELLVKAPFDDVYALYVMAQIDFFNREYNHYNNATDVFKTRLEELKAWYIRNHAHGKAENFRNVMG